jgi:hypothetical protein
MGIYCCDKDVEMAEPLEATAAIAAVVRCATQKQRRRTGVSAPHGQQSKSAGEGARATRFFLPTLFATDANKGGATGGFVPLGFTDFWASWYDRRRYEQLNKKRNRSASG